MTAIKRNLVTLGVFVAIVGMPIASAWAQTCKGNDPITPTKQVCATWDEVGDPELQQDFTVDYLCTGCSDAPRVEFSTGGVSSPIAWEIYSEVISTGAAANLGDVLLASDVSPDSGNFTVSIKKGAAAGAKNVTSLVLDSSDGDWTGHSSLGSGTEIDGVINGALKVIDRSGSGGEIAGLTVNGPTELDTVAVVGPINARRVTGTNLIDGDVTNAICIAILDYGSLTIDGEISSDLDVTVKVEEAILVVTGTVPLGVKVTIADMIGQSGSIASLRFGGLFAGDLIMTSGIDNPHAVVGLTGNFSGTIDLTDDDIAGQLNLANGDGDVLNGRSILNGAIFYPSQFNATNSYDGTATFVSVAEGGEIESKQGADIGGTIRVTDDMAGEVLIVSGSLKSGGLIDIDGNMTGEVHIGKDCVGDIEIQGYATGDIEIDENLSGSVIIGGALTDGSLLAGGRILVGGESSGAIKVGENTGSLTLIQVVEGLATGATIEINTTQGAFDAWGDIHIGGTTPVALPFDGCIRIFDQFLSGDNGDLNGNIDVIGCHSDWDQLAI